MTCASLSILMMLPLATSGVVISFLPKEVASFISVNTTFGSSFSSFHNVSDRDVHFTMFYHNPKAKYEPNRGRYLQIMSEKDLYNHMIIVSVKENDTFDSSDVFSWSFPNIFINYPLGEMRNTNTNWKHWHKAPLRLWQTQLNFAVFRASSICRVSFEHLNYKKHSMVGALYRFHMHYHMRRVLKYCRFCCLMKLVSTLLTILTVTKNSSNCVRTITFLMTQ